MKDIAVLSDSHIPERAEKIPETFWNKIEESDVTVHVGDYTAKETFNALKEYSKTFYGVKGNCDFFDHEDLKKSLTFQFSGLKFGVYHGTGITPRGHTPTLEKICLEDLEAEILITGHTHQTEITETDKCLIINPGSCTGVSGGTANSSNPSMMKINNKEDEIEIKELKEKNGECKTVNKWNFEKENLKDKTD